jgi:replication factor C large subunit
MNSPFIEKYRPKRYASLKGQEKAIAEVKTFLAEFPKRKALILHGPAGTGKTSLALAAVHENNADLLELNASDLRNRDRLENVLKPATEQQSLFKKTKILLMDEVDGVTGTDIGGIPELVRIINTTGYPIIMTCNDVWQSKLSQLRSVSKLVEMKQFSTDTILDIIRDVAKAESLTTDIIALQKIAIKAQGDLRAAINDLQSYSSGENILVDSSERRDKEDTIFNILRQLFKERGDFLELFDTTKMSLDEIFLWIEENIPREYKNETLAKAYFALSNADVFRGRIYRNQSWRFLIYQNAFQSAGISYSKLKPAFGFTKYEPPKRILKIWMHNQKTAKKKSIAKKYAQSVHCSIKRAMRDFGMLQVIMRKSSIQKQLKLSDEEVDYIKS